MHDLGQRSSAERIEGIERIIKEINLKSATQRYGFEVAGKKIEGTNVYGLLQGPRADATEAMVLIAAWKNFEGEINYSGVALALTMARYFKRWSIWSKDVILLIPEDSTYGPEAWVSAYHSTDIASTTSRNISALPIKAGALQGAVALDYPVGPWGKRFDKLDVLYDGINGALPNLDLINTAVQIASGHMGIGCSLHGLTKHSDKYPDRLRTIASGILSQAQGVATGPHSAFMPYHVDAITLKTVGDGWHDEMSLGRVTESVFRSINNLLEHLHQSFFFYILMNTNRFVSIGSYLPAAMLVAGSFTINALALWILSGRGPVQKPGKLETEGNVKPKGEKLVTIKDGGGVAVVAREELQSVERRMFLPAAIVVGTHLLSMIPLYLLTHTSKVVSTFISPFCAACANISARNCLMRSASSPPAVTYFQSISRSSWSDMLARLRSSCRPCSLSRCSSLAPHFRRGPLSISHSHSPWACSPVRSALCGHCLCAPRQASATSSVILPSL